MTYRVKINRYLNGRTDVMELMIPDRVTVTGNEDHFARAYEDARMMIAGMRALDDAFWKRATDEAEQDGEKAPVMKDHVARYRILSLEED